MSGISQGVVLTHRDGIWTSADGMRTAAPLRSGTRCRRARSALAPSTIYPLSGEVCASERI